MFDGASAVQTAVYAALDVGEVTGLGASVWAHLPEVDPSDPNSDLLKDGSIVLVHNISLEPAAGKDGGLDRATVEVVTFVREPDRSAVSGLQAAVRGLLEQQGLVLDGAVFSLPVMTSAEADLMEDGETYMGLQKFELFVQPA